MADKLTEWFILARQYPGEKYPLASVGKHPAKLKDAFDEVDLEQSLDWSGKFYGIPQILNYIIETQQYQVKPEQVLPINGGTNMGIFLTCMALLKPGDEVICETPAWTQVPSLCKRMGIKVNWLSLRSENSWKPDLKELKKLITPKTKLIYINHPNNPTGSVLSKEEMTEVCKIASKNGIYILSDEVYRGLEWKSDEFCPAVVNYYERGISTSSLTKTLGVTGLRFGWFATKDKQLYDDCFGYYYDSVLCHNIMAERIGERLLEPSRFRRLLKEGKEVGRENLKTILDLVERNDQWSFVFPGGAYSCFLKYDFDVPSWDFCEEMLKIKPMGVYLVPGISYSENCEHHFRLGFGAKSDLFKKGLHVVEEAAKKYKK